jgi:hypothetical protein
VSGTVHQELAAAQAVPGTAEEAAATFRCAVYSCTLGGQGCAARWRAAHVEDFDPSKVRDMHLEPCRDCPAGRARDRLLPRPAPAPRLPRFGSINGTTTRKPPTFIEPPEEPMAEPFTCVRCGHESTHRRVDPSDPLAPYCAQCRARAAKAHKEGGVEPLEWLKGEPRKPGRKPTPEGMLLLEAPAQVRKVEIVVPRRGDEIAVLMEERDQARTASKHLQDELQETKLRLVDLMNEREEARQAAASWHERFVDAIGERDKQRQARDDLAKAMGGHIATCNELEDELTAARARLSHAHQVRHHLLEQIEELSANLGRARAELSLVRLLGDDDDEIRKGA